MSNKKNTLATNNIPDNVVSLKHRETNINLDGEIISLIDLEKIFFLSKLNPDPAFISSILKIDVKKIDSIIHSCKFQETINEYLSEYMLGNAGEKPEQLTLRYKEFLQECFTSLRISIGLKIRDAQEKDKPLDGKFLNINLIEKLMKLEFALHGLPIDIRGYLHATKKDSKDKTEDELVESIKEFTNTLTRATNNNFNPLNFSQEITDGEIIETKELEDNNDGE